MRKDIPIFTSILIAALALESCNPFEPQSKVLAAPLEPTKTLPQPLIEPTANTIFLIPTETTTQTLENPIAQNCIMPVENGDLDSGLQYLSPIKNQGKPIKEKGGSFHHHLGWDIHSDFGVLVKNVCDGTFIWSGRVPNGDGTLGNVVVIKYTYEDNGKMETSYVRYAHMENVITDFKNGNFISKGTLIGEVGISGGGWHQPHLHMDQIYGDKWDYLMESQDIHGDLAIMAGFYAPAERWDLGLIPQYFKDVRKWLQGRLIQ